MQPSPSGHPDGCRRETKTQTWEDLWWMSTIPARETLPAQPSLPAITLILLHCASKHFQQLHPQNVPAKSSLREFWRLTISLAHIYIKTYLIYINIKPETRVGLVPRTISPLGSWAAPCTHSSCCGCLHCSRLCCAQQRGGMGRQAVTGGSQELGSAAWHICSAQERWGDPVGGVCVLASFLLSFLLGVQCWAVQHSRIAPLFSVIQSTSYNLWRG